jgi:hypothetical protein
MTDAQWIDAWPDSTSNNGPPETEDEFWSSSGSHMIRICQNRHNKKQCMVFMDGAAKKIGLKELWTFKWHKQYKTNYDGGRGNSWGEGAPISEWPEWMKDF